MVSTILSPLVLTVHTNVGGWVVFGAFGARGTRVERETQNCDTSAHPGLDHVLYSTLSRRRNRAVRNLALDFPGFASDF